MLSMPFGGATFESPIENAPSVTPSQTLRNRHLRKDSNMSSILPSPSREPAASLPPAGAGTAVVAIPAAEKAGALQRKRDDSESNPMHVIPWDQRAVIPTTGFGMGACSCCTAPRFWERVDWCLRCTCLSVVPGAIIAYTPETRKFFWIPGNMMDMPLCITSPTLGLCVLNVVATMGGYVVSVPLALAVVEVAPHATLLWLLLYFILLLFVTFFTSTTRKMSAYVISALMLSYHFDRTSVDEFYLWKYVMEATIGTAFGVIAHVLPYPMLAIRDAKVHLSLVANAVSISVQGTIFSFWAQSPLERELHLVKLVQLKKYMREAMQRVEQRINEAQYEPVGGLDLAQVSARARLDDEAGCDRQHNE